MIKMNLDSFDDYTKGNFTMTFANGYTVSIAMGDGTYSSGNFDRGFVAVEVGAWDANGDWVPLGVLDDVQGLVKADEVLDMMNRVAAMRPKLKVEEVA